ncbi:MAG: hypothetical protein ACYDAQ_13670 [Mycobacteriales bacterium]
MRIAPVAPAARAVRIASRTMLAAPLPEPARPARSRTPASIGAACRVLIVVASGESPRRSTWRLAIKVTEAGALLGFAIHRAQERVDVDEALPADPGQPVGALGQGDQMTAQHRAELARVTVGELAEELPHGRTGVDPTEELVLRITEIQHSRSPKSRR